MNNRIPVLKEEIANLVPALDRHQQDAAKVALMIGEALCEAKELCGHGQWGLFLKGCSVSSRSAQRYMRLHKAGMNSAMVAYFGLADAERYARIIELANSAGDQHLFICWEDGSGGYEHSIFWQYALDAFFLIGVRMPHNAPGEQFVMPKPLDEFHLAIAHEHLFPRMGRLYGKQVLSGDEMGKWIDDVGLEVVGHGLDTRLQWNVGHPHTYAQGEHTRMGHIDRAGV